MYLHTMPSGTHLRWTSSYTNAMRFASPPVPSNTSIGSSFCSRSKINLADWKSPCIRTATSGSCIEIADACRVSFRWASTAAGPSAFRAPRHARTLQHQRSRYRRPDDSALLGKVICLTTTNYRVFRKIRNPHRGLFQVPRNPLRGTWTLSFRNVEKVTQL